MDITGYIVKLRINNDKQYLYTEDDDRIKLGDGYSESHGKIK